METIWIIGCGRFGRIALERLDSGKRITKFVVVEPEPEHFPQPRANVKIVRQDGVDFLKQNLAGQSAPDWIIPALPVHLAVLWLMADAEPVRIRRCEPPEGLEKRLPNPIYGHTGDIYISMADFMCPDNCPEPADYCPATGKKREQNLFERLEKLDVSEFEIKIIRSHQLAPGVGGYKPESLLELKQKVSQKPGKHLIATACRCHGVITPVYTQA
ncbi:MAG: potassium transporter [Desulfosalsimonas sp.]|uniref:potassium transporter n=1 Tax=Desulfosalsimonas sp. TaxID=3073848 RepID=UPI0039708C0A